jgi:hypothetical protein
MDVVRSLPASDAAPDLARSAVDLALGNQVPPDDANGVKALADELLTETAGRAGARIIELRIRSRPRSIRLEVTWTERLSDERGLTHCLWAERSTA